MSVFDRRQIRRAFGRAATDYTQAAALQREIQARLLEQLAYLEDRAPVRVLDLGSGPGQAAGSLKKRWPRADVIALDLALPMLREVSKHTRFWRPVRRICADANALPLADASIDLVFSNLCLQWVDDLPVALAELRRVMRPDGLLLFTTFGPDTLDELRQAFAAAGLTPPLSPFAPIQAIGDALMAAGFRDPVLDRDRLTLTYPNTLALARELKAIGATDARNDRARGLVGRQRWARIEARYPERLADGRIASGWEVITAMAWAPDPSAPRREAGADIAAMAPERIPIRRRQPRD